MASRRIPRALKIALGLAVVTAIVWYPARQYLLYEFGISELTTVEGLVKRRLGLEGDPAATPPVSAPAPRATPTVIELDPDFVPFREIGASLGDRGLGNNMLIPRGAALFDANGDGRLDLYLPHSGRPRARRTDDQHILLDEPTPAKPSTLFLNLGNDERGDPILRSVQELEAAGNDRFVREELLIENKYRPRTSARDDELGPGRIATGAAAADFNGDGRMDLYVFNYHYGLPYQTHELGIRAYPARNNLGRNARSAREALVIRMPSYLWDELEDGLHASVEYGGRSEPEGRNSLYLNLGDRDGDGLPEWEDVTDAAGVGGRYATHAAAIADFDRDGDLDIYVANFIDPDFFGFGSKTFAGQRNQLYVNQLAESGALRFVDRAAELRVAGLHEEEELADGTFFPSAGGVVRTSEQIVDGRAVGEAADHSTAAAFVDWNRDGWLDLIVANDVSNRLRLYESQEGRAFRYLDGFDDPLWNGSWMGMAYGDLDGDLAPEIVVTNCGSQVMSISNNGILVDDHGAVNVQSLGALNYPEGRSTMHHALLDYEPGAGLRDVASEVKMYHSPYIPPDMTKRENIAPEYREFFDRIKFDTSFTGYEFAFNAPLFDVDNDGDLDMYMAGSLSRGNDEFFGDFSGSPGRMLVNESAAGEIAFRDRTLEYRLLDIAYMDYESNPPRRAAPGTNWHKRDYIYLMDTDGYAGSGVEASKSEINDLFRMHESTFGVYSGDLNGDGFEDIVVTHSAGYNSLAPEARNLKVSFAGRVLAVPAPNKVIKPPTNFEEGSTPVYVNGGAPPGREANWVKLRLVDRSGANHFAVGAEVVANGRLARRMMSGGAAFGGTSAALNIGLGPERLRTLEIRWPSGSPEPQRVELDPPVAGRWVCVERDVGAVPCPAQVDTLMADADASVQE